ncbi:FkbM family methyltransferase [Fluoribacter gormanii]|uniref:FkbM family methyltransferase n=1 Tax=Fluoribacter gormanii TaxID=464 RepID=UPI002243DC25|nr:FkbM family methyltransferase [Fluoribacter gormanii]MCW8445467.1 FkbM family methyltransferase [Fluoribacter gormanii]
MSFVSFAQNFEDVMLWRALKHVQNGFYIDIGAQHPVIDSVSKAFYDKGWRGIHIEPVPEFVELLRNARPDETVLQIALSDHNGLLDFNIIPGTGLSTAVDRIAESHLNELGFHSQKAQVPTLTLQSAMSTLVENDVHWMKIDVEGFEKQVLSGWDYTSLRPWIIVIEATVPHSSKINYAQWEPLLIAADYLFVYFDGLNRFYVAKEHPELMDAFISPPNIFDQWQLTESSSLCHELVSAYTVKINTVLEQTASELNLAKEYNAQQQNHIESLQQEKDALVQELGLQKEYLAHHQVFVQNLQHELNSANQKLGSLSEDLIVTKEHHREEQVRAQNLQWELNSANQKLGALSDGLIAEKEFRRKEQEHAQNLQNELNSANQKLASVNEELIEEKEHCRKEQVHFQKLQNELNSANQKLDSLSDELIEEKEQRRKEQAHIQKLQNELNSASQKLDSLNEELIEEKERRRKEQTHIQTSQQNHIAQVSTKNPTHIKSLLCRQGEDFIYHAYLYGLNREPDPEGMQYFLEQLAVGRDKILILRDLINSPEGRSKKTRVKGFNKAWFLYRRRNWPVISLYFRTVYEKKNSKIKQQTLSPDNTSKVEFELDHLSEHERHVFYQFKKCIDVGAC